MTIILSEPEVHELHVERIEPGARPRPVIGSRYTTPQPRGEQRTVCGQYAQTYPELGRDALRLQRAMLEPARTEFRSTVLISLLAICTLVGILAGVLR